MCKEQVEDCAYSRVDQQEKDDTDEILPVRGPTLTVGESNSDDSGTLHDPREGVPHEAEELQDSRLLLCLELVVAKDPDTLGGFSLGETSLSGLEQGPDILEDDLLEIDLVLVVLLVIECERAMPWEKETGRTDGRERTKGEEARSAQVQMYHCCALQRLRRWSFLHFSPNPSPIACNPVL